MQLTKLVEDCLALTTLTAHEAFYHFDQSQLHSRSSLNQPDSFPLSFLIPSSNVIFRQLYCICITFTLTCFRLGH